MIAVEQLLQEPVMILNLLAMVWGSKAKVTTIVQNNAFTYILIVATKDAKQAKLYSSFHFLHPNSKLFSLCPLRDLTSLKFFSQHPAVHFKLEQAHNLLPCMLQTGTLKLEDLPVSIGNIFIPGLAILDFILIRCWQNVALLSMTKWRCEKT